MSLLGDRGLSPQAGGAKAHRGGVSAVQDSLTAADGSRFPSVQHSGTAHAAKAGGGAVKVDDGLCAVAVRTGGVEI